MILKVIILLGLTVSIYGAAISQMEHGSAPEEPKEDEKYTGFGQQMPDHQEKHVWSSPKYSFSYAVSDPYTRDFKGQYEMMDGDELSGEYWLLEPDNTKRTVTYHANDKTGFNAVVTRSHLHSWAYAPHKKHASQLSYEVKEDTQEGGDTRSKDSGSQSDGGKNNDASKKENLESDEESSKKQESHVDQASGNHNDERPNETSYDYLKTDVESSVKANSESYANREAAADSSTRPKSKRHRGSGLGGRRSPTASGNWRSSSEGNWELESDENKAPGKTNGLENRDSLVELERENKPQLGRDDQEPSIKRRTHYCCTHHIFRKPGQERRTYRGRGLDDDNSSQLRRRPVTNNGIIKKPDGTGGPITRGDDVPRLNPNKNPGSVDDNDPNSRDNPVSQKNNDFSPHDKRYQETSNKDCFKTNGNRRQKMCKGPDSEKKIGSKPNIRTDAPQNDNKIALPSLSRNENAKDDRISPGKVGRSRPYQRGNPIQGIGRQTISHRPEESKSDYQPDTASHPERQHKNKSRPKSSEYIEHQDKAYEPRSRVQFTSPESSENGGGRPRGKSTRFWPDKRWQGQHTSRQNDGRQTGENSHLSNANSARGSHYQRQPKTQHASEPDNDQEPQKNPAPQREQEPVHEQESQYEQGSQNGLERQYEEEAQHEHNREPQYKQESINEKSHQPEQNQKEPRRELGPQPEPEPHHEQENLNEKGNQQPNEPQNKLEPRKELDPQLELESHHGEENQNEKGPQHQQEHLFEPEFQHELKTHPDLEPHHRMEPHFRYSHQPYISLVAKDWNYRRGNHQNQHRWVYIPTHKQSY